MNTLTAPVKGMVWKHAKRKDREGNPKVLTVTCVRNGMVHSRTDLGGKVKTSVRGFAEEFCLEVVSVPGPKPRSTAPRLSVSQIKALHDKAHAAGEAAAEAAVPTPMHVVQHANPFDDNSPVVKAYAPVMSGVCGFAWINIPGNSAFARFAKKMDLGSKSYYGGFDIRVRGYGQSYEKKMAYAAAYAGVLQEAGIKAYAQGRLD